MYIYIYIYVKPKSLQAPWFSTSSFFFFKKLFLMIYCIRIYQFWIPIYTTPPAFSSPFFLSSSSSSFFFKIFYYYIRIYQFRTPIQLYNSLFSLHVKVKVLNPQTSLFSNIRWHPKTQILSPPPPPWITATASISLCLSIVSQSSPSYSMSANYFEVIKTCFLLSLISIYCSLSLFASIVYGILLVCGCGLLWI